ncbi:hypothetical protein [Thioalkalivibrio sp. AKL19]|uniref:hypothetical protein n=1 Tax=Thioalkalivibrio sp. AKL19 TaxID=1266914 RepID=UPI00046256DA|nr:hypothetical protein [Thioalkalivibrio sp. AKL19]
MIHLLPGLWASPGATAADGSAPLRRLARWLGRARPVEGRGTAPGWEAALAQRLGYRQQGAGSRTWLAQPVQLTPGMRDLVASPVDTVADAERQALWSAAQPELEAAGATLALDDDGLWVLSMDAEGDASGPPPSVGLGRSMVAHSLQGDVARRLQVLATGLQMAWFQHPVNLERERQGRGAVHGLWLWTPGYAGGPTGVQRVCGGGAIGRWLARGAGIDWCPDPAGTSAESGDTVVVVDALGAPPSPERRLELLESLADDVVAPRVHALLRGGLGSLEFVDPQSVDSALRLERRQMLAFWRRPRRP